MLRGYPGCLCCTSSCVVARREPCETLAWHEVLGIDGQAATQCWRQRHAEAVLPWKLAVGDTPQSMRMWRYSQLLERGVYRHGGSREMGAGNSNPSPPLCVRPVRSLSSRSRAPPLFTATCTRRARGYCAARGCLAPSQLACPCVMTPARPSGTEGLAGLACSLSRRLPRRGPVVGHL